MTARVSDMPRGVQRMQAVGQRAIWETAPGFIYRQPRWEGVYFVDVDALEYDDWDRLVAGGTMAVSDNEWRHRVLGVWGFDSEAEALRWVGMDAVIPNANGCAL